MFLHFGSTILHGAPSTRVSVQHLQLFGIGDSSGAIGSGGAQHAAPLGSARRAARRCAAWSSTWCSPAARIVCKGHSGSASASRRAAGTTRGECTYVDTDPSCLSGAAGAIHILAGGQRYTGARTAWDSAYSDPVELNGRFKMMPGGTLCPCDPAWCVAAQESIKNQESKQQSCSRAAVARRRTPVGDFRIRIKI